jgi:NADPH:quinone reductase-like Zn-dependent oxidoreductase
MKNIKMTSLMMTKYGDINETLEFQEISKPTISSKQILIKTKAASYNPLDYKIIRGDFKSVRKIDFPKGIGRDVSGIVEDIGPDVKDFKIGDNVFSRIGEEHVGTMAEYVVSKESDVSLMPSNLNFIESASIPLAGLTVYQSLVDIAKLSAGENILIYAGSGGVGTIAIQLSKHLGANVTTTTSTNNIDMVKNLGADKVIDYTKQSFLDDNEKYDAVYDTLGGKHTVDSFKVLKENGRVVSIAGDLDDITAKQLGLNKFIRFILSLKARKITKAASRINASYRFYLMSPNGKQLNELAKLYEKESIKPVIDKTYTFEESITAIDYLSKGRAKGKVVIEFPD